jgi:hypothetical protein
MGNVDFHNIDASPFVIKANKSRIMERPGHVSCIEEMRNAYKILVRNPEEKSLFGRRKHRWGILSRSIVEK